VLSWDWNRTIQIQYKNVLLEGGVWGGGEELSCGDGVGERRGIYEKRKENNNKTFDIFS